MTRHAITLGTVQETLLIPLYGRAVENNKPLPALRDERAAEIVDSLDYDFSRFDGLQSLLGAVLRTSVFDHWVRGFLAEHPEGTVVEIGTGLNTRFERVDNGRARWFELDLPDVIELRRTFFEDTERRTMLAGSVTEESWCEAVAAGGGSGPLLFCAEAVLPFLTEKQVRQVVTMIAARFPGSLLALDTSSPQIVASQDVHDALSKVEARMQWGCADPAELADWLPGTRVTATHRLTDLPAEVHDPLPAGYRTMLADLAEQRLPQVEGYRLSRFRLP
jgi:O-methyltransferase involved in polyketide biosynthesis